VGFSLLPFSVHEYDRPRIRPVRARPRGRVGRPHLTHLTHLTHCRSSPAERDRRGLCNLIGPELAGSTINGEDPLHLFVATVASGRRSGRRGAPGAGGLGAPPISAGRVRSNDGDHRRVRPAYRRRDGRGRRHRDRAADHARESPGRAPIGTPLESTRTEDPVTPCGLPAPPGARTAFRCELLPR